MSRPEIVLGIDTSDLAGALGLVGAEGVIDAVPLEMGKRHGQTLVPAILRLLEAHGFALSQLAALAVNTGPGSFTGLRVGVVCAKTLAYALKCQVLELDTYHLLAANAEPDVARLRVVLDAQRGELFVQDLQRDALGQWTISAAEAVCSQESFIEVCRPDDVLTGPALRSLAERLESRCRLLPADAWQTDPRQLAALSWHAWKSRAFADPFALEPRYVRRSSAEDKWDADPGARHFRTQGDRPD